MNDDLIRRGDALAMLLAMRGPVDVPRTDKAVWLDEGIDRCIEELRDMPSATSMVKPLAWEELIDGNHRKGECFYTRSPVNLAPISAHKKHDGWWLSVDCKTYPTLDAAKAAAQADYEARIFAVLDMQPGPDAQAIREAALREAADMFGPIVRDAILALIGTTAEGGA